MPFRRMRVTILFVLRPVSILLVWILVFGVCGSLTYITEFSSAQEDPVGNQQASAPPARPELYPRLHFPLKDDHRLHFLRVNVETPREGVVDPRERFLPQEPPSLGPPDNLLVKHHVFRI